MNRLVTGALTLALTAPAVLTAHAEQPKDPLTRAYLKELAFLKAQKEALQARTAELDAQSASRVARARQDIEALQAKLLGLRRRADRSEDKLREAETASETVDRTATVIDLVQRAREPLAAAGISTAATSSGDTMTRTELRDALQATLAGATTLISGASKVQVTPGSFFLTSGDQVQGTVIKVGRVASFGVSDKGSGALVPAGAGRFRLWDEPSAATAQALTKGEAPASLDIFLYEATDKPVEKKKEKTIASELAAGGLIAYVIAGLGIIALLLIFIRAASLLQFVRTSDAAVEATVTPTAQGKITAARDAAMRHTGPTARVVQAVLANIHRQKETLDDIVHEAVLNEIPRIERFGATIVVFAAVAPLLGLLGTVTGMISTFDIITEFGTGDPRMLSGGISEALITTKLGLIVAIPTLLMGTLLNARAETFITGLQHAATRVINAAEGTRAPTNQEPPEELRPSTTIVQGA